MTTRETLPAILERLVAQLWLTAGAILLVRALLPAPEASPGVKRMPPAWCQALSTVTGTACRWTDDETTLLAPDPRQVILQRQPFWSNADRTARHPLRASVRVICPRTASNSTPLQHTSLMPAPRC